MLGRSIMEFYIRIVRGGKGRKNTVGANITADGAENITNLFLQIYRNSKGHGRTLQQFPGGNDATAPALEKPKTPTNRIQRMPETEKRKKGSSDTFLKVLEDFVDYFINICEPKRE